MTDPFVAEIRVFPFDFAPQGWAFCDGQLLPLPQNNNLFSLMGTLYGGNGKTNFALPNLQGRVAISCGQGAGGYDYGVGESGGAEAVRLDLTQIPAHSHEMIASGADVSEQGVKVAAGNVPGKQQASNPIYGDVSAGQVTMANQALALSGGSAPHNNMMPYITLNLCIALQGVFPHRAP
jgi:microcystin-dependent protein